MSAFLTILIILFFIIIILLVLSFPAIVFIILLKKMPSYLKNIKITNIPLEGRQGFQEATQIKIPLRWLIIGGIFFLIIIYTRFGKIVFFFSFWTFCNLLFLSNGIGLFRKRMLIKNMPTSKIRSIAMGLVEVYGEVIPIKDNILKSPFTNQDCIYYKCTITLGKENYFEEDIIKFYLKDETGTVLVDPTGANFNLDPSKTFEYHTKRGSAPPQTIIDFLKKNNFNTETYLSPETIYIEYLIKTRDKLYIIGTAIDSPHVEDGTEKEGMPDIMITEGKNEKFYYISDSPEKKVLKTMLKTAIWQSAVSSVMLLIGLAIILKTYNII